MPEVSVEKFIDACAKVVRANEAYVPPYRTGAANFFGITKDNKFITPSSPSILPSITKYSLLHVAKGYLGMETEVDPVTKKLYETLYGIQFGDVEALEGWIVEV